MALQGISHHSLFKLCRLFHPSQSTHTHPGHLERKRKEKHSHFQTESLSDIYMLLYSTFTSNHVLYSQLWYSVLKLNHYTTCCRHIFLHWMTVKCPYKHVALFHRMTCCRVSFEPLCDLLPYPKFMSSHCKTRCRMLVPRGITVYNYDAVSHFCVESLYIKPRWVMQPYPVFVVIISLHNVRSCGPC